MSRAVVLSAVRTPIGRYGGALSGVRPDDLAALVIREAVARAGVPAEQIEDVWFGCANQAGEDNRNVARMAALLAGLPETVGRCHGQPALRLGPRGRRRRVPRRDRRRRRPLRRGRRGVDDPRAVRDAEGREDRSSAATGPLYDTTLGWRFTNPKLVELFPPESMGETGENVAERWGVSREDQDAFALESQQRWAAADEAGRFADELVPVGDVDARRAPAARHHAPRSSPRSSPRSAMAARSPPGTRPGSTTAPRRS